jgi:hypothetical protein
MANTTNFGWETPDDTDLVKDGAAAIRTLGSSIDTSLVDLKGGTTGQVLSKATNTDMDFTWVAQDDSNAIQNAIVDAKGDIISATAADTPARLAVGADNTVLTADSSTATGLKWATPASGMTNPMTTTGDTIYSSSGSTPARLAIGSTGNVLTVAGGVPTWAAPATGGMTLISTTTLSGSSTVLSSIPSTYTNLQVQIEGMTNNTAAGTFTIYVGSVDDAQGITINDASVSTFGGGGNLAVPSTIVRTNSENGFILTIFNYSASIVNHSFSMVGSYTTSGALKRFAAFGTDGSSGSPHTISSLTFLNTGGTWASGTVKLWGIK